MHANRLRGRLVRRRSAASIHAARTSLDLPMPSIRSSMQEQIQAARDRLAGIVQPTPLIRSETLDRVVGAHVLLKPENLQKTGSFKIRGAYNRLATLTGERRERGGVGARAGEPGHGAPPPA